ncbi:hypothetical protein COCCADRAFT_27748 [Bipolaris zeicola 26-R-13]|uniref:Uncharacterized protein n=1 Tax=Cochliobolus carbonum (strain 26-R-13) TaxID=930089 RepID=W6XVQ5_COCC2|nr:uncharacterized protein COCCADRAFT_27748 [Bipolaris zeicola 26-R-13]EUC31527.1 hypothetical protein COCCADRAFT_27748 [Bipolaris zeicola 26-R-13]
MWRAGAQGSSWWRMQSRAGAGGTVWAIICRRFYTYTDMCIYHVHTHGGVRRSSQAKQFAASRAKIRGRSGHGEDGRLVPYIWPCESLFPYCAFAPDRAENAWAGLGRSGQCVICVWGHESVSDRSLQGEACHWRNRGRADRSDRPFANTAQFRLLLPSAPFSPGCLPLLRTLHSNTQTHTHSHTCTCKPARPPAEGATPLRPVTPEEKNLREKKEDQGETSLIHRASADTWAWGRGGWRWGVVWPREYWFLPHTVRGQTEDHLGDHGRSRRETLFALCPRILLTLPHAYAAVFTRRLVWHGQKRKHKRTPPAVCPLLRPRARAQKPMNSNPSYAYATSSRSPGDSDGCWLREVTRLVVPAASVS